MVPEIWVDYARKLKKRQGRLSDTWQLTQSSSPFKENESICGVPSIKTVISLTSWYSVAAISALRNASSVAY